MIVKLLGIEIDQKLPFEPHLESLCQANQAKTQRNVTVLTLLC